MKSLIKSFSWLILLTIFAIMINVIVVSFSVGILSFSISWIILAPCYMWAIVHIWRSNRLYRNVGFTLAAISVIVILGIGIGFSIFLYYVALTGQWPMIISMSYILQIVAFISLLIACFGFIFGYIIYQKQVSS
jgi:hypothetical protein